MTMPSKETKLYDVWKNRDGRYTSTLAMKEFVDELDAPYGFHAHEIRVAATNGRDAINRAKKAERNA